VNRACPSCGTTFPAEVFFCGHCGAITVEEQDPNDPDPRLGQTLGQYVIVARVADGAMGRVYEGRHPETKARVAVKVLHSDVARDGVSVERFKREFETAQGFDHPHIVEVLEYGDTEDGSHFLTMEYLQGEELGKVLKRDGSLDPARMVRIVCQTALAIEHAHSFGVIHRDLKPDNIFLARGETGDDEVRILDFGSVKLQVEMGPKLTAFGTTLGSPYYMSPEQAMGKLDVDKRSDVFALGAIAYEMATGEVAFGGGQVAEILMKIMNHTPPGPSTMNRRLPAAFDDVVEKSLRKDKARRYGSTGELAQAMLESFGMAGTVEQWARAPVSQVTEALDQAQPPAPKPYGASLPPPAPQVSGAPVPGSLEGPGDDVITRPSASSVGVLVGLALGGLVVLGCAVVAAFLLLT
jgi:serine/threonine protein kinase